MELGNRNLGCKMCFFKHFQLPVKCVKSFTELITFFTFWHYDLPLDSVFVSNEKELDSLLWVIII